MPQTIDTTTQGQIIGGTFSSRENADKAVEAFHDLGISSAEIQVIVQLNDSTPEDVFTDVLTERGFANSQARFYDKAIRDGKVLVVVYHVTDPAEIIDIFDRNQAEYNPDGSRNVRDDVAGLTIGAALGCVAGGVAGAAIAGPAGIAAGAGVGIVLGGGTGMAAGAAAEHKK